MHLFVTGDSYTYGQELADSPDGAFCVDEEYRLSKSWSGVLASIMGFESCHNAGLGGTGHDYAARQTLRYAADWLAEGKDPADLFIVIGWSHHARREFYVDPGHQEENEGSYFRFHQRYRRMGWLTDQQHEMLTLYRDHMMSDPESMTRALQHVTTVQTFLKSYGFPFLFFNSAWLLKPEMSLSSSLAKLIDTRRYYYHNVPRYSFAAWMTYENVGDRKPKGHPDETAHAAWATNLMGYINGNDLLVPD